MRVKLQKTKYPFFLFLCVFFVLLPWIFFDVDVGDQAYSSVSSWLLAFQKRPLGTPELWYDTTPIWFSLFLNSLWWRLIGPEASLLAERLGWILLNASTAVILFFTLRSYYEEKKVFLALFLTALLVNCAADHFIITYNSAGPALGAISFALFARTYSLSRHEPKILFALGSGFFAIVAIQAKLPSLPFVGLFFFCSLVLELRSSFKTVLLRFSALGAGLALGILFALAALYATNQWEMYFAGFKKFFTLVASSSSNRRTENTIVLLRVVGHYKKIALGTLFFGAMILAISYAGKWKNIALAAGLAIFAFLVTEKYGVALAMLLGAPLFLHSLKFWQEKKWPPIGKVIFLGGGLLVLAAFTFGTTLEGVQNFKYGLWIWFPFAYLETESFEFKWIDTKLTRRFLVAAACLLFLITRLQWPTFPYLERTIFSMRAPFQTRFLKGIFSYPEKQAALDGLATELNHLGVKEGDTLLAYAGAPPYYPTALVYPITRTIPLFHNPCLIEYPGFNWPTHREVLLALAAKNELPKIIVRQKIGFLGHPAGVKTFFLDIPAVTDEPFQWTTPEKNGLAGELDTILQTHGYLPTWQNAHYVILERQGG